jgi:hypothetical protein
MVLLRAATFQRQRPPFDARLSHHFSHHPGVTGWTSRLRHHRVFNYLALPVTARNGPFRFHTVKAEGSIPSTPTQDFKYLGETWSSVKVVRDEFRDEFLARASSCHRRWSGVFAQTPRREPNRSAVPRHTEHPLLLSALHPIPLSVALSRRFERLVTECCSDGV